MGVGLEKHRPVIVSANATYLYCVVRAPRRPAATKVPPGVPDGTAPDVVALAPSLWLVTSQVPLDVYGSPHLDARLRDLDWVSDAAVAHEAVVERFAAAPATTVVPMKLFTMFSSIDRAIEDVRGRRAALQRVLKRIAGCEEWGIRVTRSRSLPPPVEPGHGKTKRAAGTVQASSGVAFLTARKNARDAARQLRARALECADAAFKRLRRIARDARRREARSEPGTNPPILEAAFLVPAAARARFKAEARRLASACAAAGADMMLTGPWPAYNFVQEEART